MLTHEERELAKRIKEMTDISDIKVNRAHTKKQRIRSFIEQAGDPYCLKYGTALVEMTYSEDADAPIRLAERLKEVMEEKAAEQIKNIVESPDFIR